MAGLVPAVTLQDVILRRPGVRREDVDAGGIEEHADILAGMGGRVAVVLHDDLAGRRVDIHDRRIAEALEELHRAGQARGGITGADEVVDDVLRERLEALRRE